MSDLTRREYARLHREQKLARAEVVIKALLAEFRIGREDLFRSRYAEHATARHAAINKLREHRFSTRIIAEATGLCVSTVEYWVYSKERSRQLARGNARLAAMREARA